MTFISHSCAIVHHQPSKPATLTLTVVGDWLAFISVWNIGLLQKC